MSLNYYEKIGGVFIVARLVIQCLLNTAIHYSLYGALAGSMASFRFKKEHSNISTKHENRLLHLFQ